MFSIFDMPSGQVLIKGYLIQKKLTVRANRMVMLCFPKTVDDVKFLHEHMTLTDKMTGELRPLDKGTGAVASEKDMFIYGHLSLSAIYGYPLLIIGTSAKTFIHFSQIQGI